MPAMRILCGSLAGDAHDAAAGWQVPPNTPAANGRLDGAARSPSARARDRRHFQRAQTEAIQYCLELTLQRYASEILLAAERERLPAQAVNQRWRILQKTAPNSALSGRGAGTCAGRGIQFGEAYVCEPEGTSWVSR